MSGLLQQIDFFFRQAHVRTLIRISGTEGILQTAFLGKKLIKHAGVQILSATHVSVMDMVIIIGSALRNSHIQGKPAFPNQGIVANRFPSIALRNVGQLKILRQTK